MSCINSNILAGASGAGGDKVYVDDVFSPFVYKGAGGNTINNGIDLDGEGGLVWVKCRSANEDNILVDTERGLSNYALISNAAHGPYASTNTVTAFNSNGFNVGANGRTGENGKDYASWTFRKAPGFFDVVTWNGQSNNGVYDTWITVPHNLKSTPGMIIIKCYSDTYPGTSNPISEGWIVWHRSLPTSSASLENTSAFGANYQYNFGYSSGAADADNIYVRAGQFKSGYAGLSYVAYIFAHDSQSFGTDEDESIIKCGTFTSGSNTQIVDINLGFEPQFFLVKNSSAGGDWFMIDNMRGFCAEGTLGPQNKVLRANTTQPDGAEHYWRPTATGISGFPGGNSATYIYMAIRRPNKPPTAATEVFAVATGNSSNPIPAFVSNFTVDTAFLINYNSNSDHYLTSRLTNGAYLRTNTNEKQVTGTGETFDSNTGWARIYDSTRLSYMFKRAPGFMDMVSYDGDSNASSQKPHNLKVKPEMILIKNRDYASGSTGMNWTIWHKDIFDTQIVLNTSDPWLNSGPSSTYGGSGYGTGTGAKLLSSTSTHFLTGSGALENGSGREYLAYLFATLPGISKVGSYSGTGNAINVDCGFTNGARFVLIKRVDWYGGWYVWDTLRGIVTGNDPYLLLDTNAAQVTVTDYIDPLSTGFTVAASGVNDLNTSGGTYIFLAFA